MKELVLSKSKIKNKKYTAVLFEDGKKIKTFHFGDNRYEDYLIHQDDERKQRYIQRHKGTVYLFSITPASLSMYLLWNKKTLEKSIRDFEKKFKVKIKIK